MVSSKTPTKTPTKPRKSAFDAHYARASSLGSPTSPSPKDSSRKRKMSTSKDKPKEWEFTHHVPTPDQKKKNGRHEGRSLIAWTRPRMAEKLLLHLQYECNRYKIDIPWDAIAHRLHPGSSGGAVLQHLNRLRGQLVAEGHLVPPLAQKPGARVAVDPSVRGHIRAFPDTDDVTTTRPVPFHEICDDRRFNLPDAYDERTPSSQVKLENVAITTPPPTIGPPTPDSMLVVAPAMPAMPTTPTPKAKPKTKPAKPTKVKRERMPSPDLGDLDSEAEYKPGSQYQPHRPKRRTAKPKASYVEIDDECEGDLGHDSVETTPADDDSNIENDAEKVFAPVTTTKMETVEELPSGSDDVNENIGAIYTIADPAQIGNSHNTFADAVDAYAMLGSDFLGSSGDFSGVSEPVSSAATADILGFFPNFVEDADQGDYDPYNDNFTTALEGIMQSRQAYADVDDPFVTNYQTDGHATISPDSSTPLNHDQTTYSDPCSEFLVDDSGEEVAI